METTLPIGTIIRDHYFVQGLLGKSDFDAVYLVRDQHMKRNIFTLFVLKEIINLSKQEQCQFISEAMLLKRLHHRALPHVYEVFSDDERDRIYVLMDYIEGLNLEILRLRQPKKCFSWSQALALMAPIMDAVTYMHSQQPPTIHQDIKPTNIILPKAGDNAVLVNFDIAKKYSLTSAKADSRRSLPGYRAPEQYNGGETSPRTDIYGIGATFYTLLTGIAPIPAIYRKAQLKSGGIDPLKPVNQVVQDIPMGAAEIIHHAMSLSSNDRFSTVEQLWQALNTYPMSQQSPEPIIKQAVARPATVSVPKPPAPRSWMPGTRGPARAEQIEKKSVPVPMLKPPHARRSRKLGTLWSVVREKLASTSVPKPQYAGPSWKPDTFGRIVPKRAGEKPAPVTVSKPPRTARFGGLRILLSVLLALIMIISLGTVLWSYAVSYHDPGSAAPTTVLVHKATIPSSPASTVTPTSKATATATLPPSSVTIAASYNGTIYDMLGGVSSKLSLTNIQQSQMIIHGYFNGLKINEPFKGSVDASGHIQFTVIDPVMNVTLSFEGMVRSDHNLAGSYCGLDQQEQCANDYGIWSLAPAP